jgi:hypothetical protein
MMNTCLNYIMQGSILSKFDEDRDAYFNGIDEALRMVPKEGVAGEFPCPVCKTGTVKWIRVPYNRHLRMGCSTPECVMLMQ